MFCPNCGKEVGEGIKFCPSCGMPMSAGAQSQASPVAGSPADPTVTMIMNKKSEGLAVFMSLILPGIGLIYIGKVVQGILIFPVSLISMFVFLFFPLSVSTAVPVLAVILALVLWIYGMYGAYMGAKEYNEYLVQHNGQSPQ